jgi:isopenicillin-N N-acyltransferase-like protein
MSTVSSVGSLTVPTRRRFRALLFAMALALVLPASGHALIVVLTRIVPPAVILPENHARSFAATVGGLREVHLYGSPEQIGAAEARLLRDRMIVDEAQLWERFEHYVPWWTARVAIEDVSRLRYRRVDRGIPEARRRELAAQSLAFEPDPFTAHMPTYQRMVFLHALYDIALSFEHSPLIGCSTFAMGRSMTTDGHAIVARTFDMETDDVLDRDKAVFLLREEGAIPFASVAWPGFVGVVTGMNVEGVLAVVHGGRARNPRAEGTPVAFSLREVLERAHSTAEAVAILRGQEVMVSHIVFVADGAGRFAIIERAPGVPPYVRETTETTVVTNDFEGPLSDDPKNREVREKTTSITRKTQLNRLLSGLVPGTGSPGAALELLRDHGCCESECTCELGDRRAVDALIATHGIVADTTSATLWVSVGPHLSGRFVRLDLRTLLAADQAPYGAGEPETMPEDPVLSDGRYERALRSRKR